METILSLTVPSGLKFPIPKNYNDKVIPTDTFGVFVGIERSKKHTLPKWPNDIHGCIGYWDSNYQNINNKFILQKIKDVSYDSTWVDDRRNYFINTIYIDLYAKYKIYFMKNPIKKVNIMSGIIESTQEIFNNKNYGLIVENVKNKNQRATYLPDVFPNKSWDLIRESLLKKASASNLDSIIFYAYECDIYDMTISQYLINPFQKFINTKYGKFVPYMVSNNNIVIIKSENIRNLATIYDILQMANYGFLLNDFVLNAIQDNLNFYKNKYFDNPNKLRQASPFLMLSLNLINKNDNTINVIKNNLIKQLELQNKFNIDNKKIEGFSPIDLNFEFGEILMALLEIDPNDHIVKKELIKISVHDPAESGIDIFRYNWYSKCSRWFPDSNYRYKLLDKIIKYMKIYTNNETNYCAVQFESLATLYALIDDKNIRLSIEPYISNLMILLESRKNINGLYEFTDGTMRLDITGHVLNGFYALMSILEK